MYISMVWNALSANLSAIFVSLFLQLFLGKLDEMLVWIISFLAIRTQLGGYHCSNHFRCLLFSTLLGISGMFLNTIWFRFPIIAFMIILFCFLFIKKYAPPFGIVARKGIAFYYP